MQRVRDRDQVAFGLLLERHLPAIHGYLVRMTGSPADADELAQETFLRLWTRAASYRPGAAKLTTWLHRIAHNLCVDERRKVRPEVLDEPALIADQAPGPDRHHEARETAARLTRAIGELPVAQRAALLLAQVQGLSNGEIAEILNLSVRAVESLQARARGTLRERMTET
jgi:RNA polymerase sigma-70 factor, ECF subfamily